MSSSLLQCVWNYGLKRFYCFNIAGRNTVSKMLGRYLHNMEGYKKAYFDTNCLRNPENTLHCVVQENIDLENLSTNLCQSWALSSKGGSIITCGRDIRQQENKG